VIVGVQAIPACFDVEQNRCTCSPVALEAHLQAYDSLLQYQLRSDSSGYKLLDVKSLKPCLAQSWEISSDGRTCSLQLRKGILSAAGNELTAHDVKWSWERCFALNSWSARIARLAGVSSPDMVRAPQTYTVQFRLDRPSTLLPRALASTFPAIYDLEEVRGHCPVGDPWGHVWLSQHTAGFGPYTLQRAVEGEEATLVANPNYWQGPVLERRVLLRVTLPVEARSGALRRGSLEIATDLPAGEIRALARQAGARVAEYPSQRQVVLRLDPSYAPFDQRQVRQALRLLMPYEDISQVLCLEPAAAVHAEQDLRLARTLLKEAGYGSGFRTTVYLPAGSPDLQAVAQLVQIGAIRADLKIVVEPMSPALFAREKAARHLPIYLEERSPIEALFSPEELEPLPDVEAVLLAQPHQYFAARSNVRGFIRRPDGRPRYYELRKVQA